MLTNYICDHHTIERGK